MGLDNILSLIGVSGSGMSAERTRMEVIANNIANVNSTRTPSGGAFRRKQVVFEDMVERANGSRFGGVHVIGIDEDMSDLPRVYDPGHVDADGDGYVTMPNVNIPLEMADLVTASRGYEANLRVIKTFREMVDQSLSLLRGA